MIDRSGVVLCAHHVGYDGCTLDASRLDGLEEVDQTLRLESLQLRVDVEECATPTASIAGGEEREKEERKEREGKRVTKRREG